MLRRFLHFFDIFKAPAIFRAKGEPEVSRFCSGALSFMIICLFVYALASNLYKLFIYQQIESSLISQVQQDMNLPQYSNISISISMGWQNLTIVERSFQIFVYLITSSQNNFSFLELQTELCKKEQWSQFGQIYTAYHMKQNLCIKNPEKVRLKGTNRLQTIQFLVILIGRCQNTSEITCYSDEQFAQVLEGMYASKSNYFSIYLPDNRINQYKQDPVDEFLSLNYNYYYTNETRTTLKLYLGTYVVETDDSALPFYKDMKTKTGYYISEVSQSIRSKENQLLNGIDYYGNIEIYMSTDRLKYERKKGKINNVISFVGGLFGLIIKVVAILVYSYNKFCYQILVAQKSFNYEESGRKVMMDKFNVYGYIKFQVYQWISLLKRTPNWENSEMIYKSKEEANLELDVEYLFRRLRIIDLALQRRLAKQSALLNLVQSPSLQEVKQSRKFTEYYDSIIGGADAINIEDLRREIQASSDSNLKNQGENNLYQSQDLFASVANLVRPQQNQFQSNKKDEEFKKQIKENLKISDPKIVQKLLKYKYIYDEAKNMEVPKNIPQLEEKFASIYVNVEQSTRNLVLDKIPLKILFRFSISMEKNRKPIQKKDI